MLRLSLHPGTDAAQDINVKWQDFIYPACIYVYRTATTKPGYVRLIVLVLQAHTFMPAHTTKSILNNSSVWGCTTLICEGERMIFCRFLSKIRQCARPKPASVCVIHAKNEDHTEILPLHK